MPAARPTRFEEFHGQEAAVRLLRTVVRSALHRKAVLGHILLTGPRGCGKTSLAAHVVPTELGVKATSLVCSDTMEAADLVAVVGQIRGGDVLFLDEVHALKRTVQETLYPLLEDSAIMLTLGEGANARPTLIPVPPFTVIMATTREGLLADPLRDRVKTHAKLDLYTDSEMSQILAWTAQKLQAQLGDPGLLVAACHGTARHASRLLEACIDTVFEHGAVEQVIITPAVIGETMKRLGFSPNGLGESEVRLLEFLAKQNRPVGVNTLGAFLDEESTTIESVYEPWLLRMGFVQRTASGREITPQGREALHVARSR